MTKSETEFLLKYMLTMYPGVKMSEQQFANTVQIWTVEFANDSKELVGEAFRYARSESPDWMPSVPKLQNAIKMISSRVKMKSKEQEFRDTHCGKSEAEWKKLVEWENSSQGIDKINSYKKRLMALLGGKDEAV